LPAQGVDGEIVGRPLGPTMLSIVVVGAIVIVFAVSLVVLVIVTHQVVDCRHEGFIVNPLPGS
jgi:hypothetical protein